MRYLLLILGVAGAVAAYTVYWFAIAGRAETAIQEALSEGTRTVALSAADTNFSGYPYRITGTFIEPRAAARDGTWNWATPALEVFAQPYDLAHLIISAPGPHTISVAPPLAPRQTYTVTTRTARASFIAGEDGPRRLDASIEGASLASLAGETLNAGQIEFHALPHPEVPGALQAAAILRNISGNLLARAPIQSDIALAQMLLRFDDVPRLEMLEPLLDGRWPAGVQTIDIEEAGLVWDKLTIAAKGQIRRDPQYRPTGAIQLVINGHQAAISGARQNGSLAPGMAATLETALGVLGVLSGNGQVSATLILRDGFAFLGPIRLFALEPLN